MLIKCRLLVVKVWWCPVLYFEFEHAPSVRWNIAPGFKCGLLIEAIMQREPHIKGKKDQPCGGKPDKHDCGGSQGQHSVTLMTHALCNVRMTVTGGLPP